MLVSSLQHDIRDLEAALAKYHQREDCLSFTSLEEGLRFIFNALFTKDDVIFFDEYNSLAAKTAVEVSGAKKTTYRHCDIDGKKFTILSTLSLYILDKKTL